MCTINYKNKKGCPGLIMDMDSSEGDNAAEVITCDHPSNFFYLIFVHNHDHDHVNLLVRSGVYMALFGNSKQVEHFHCPTIDLYRETRSD